eukprot:CAMPEP_0182820986 /NCGR_PEP_ID=MMETSP0006_2-20121128/13421_1 /TAXON_ID=97485 /ORGANISM="Prymnesium parvum, Strain Texoma1" /LENGTH=135 /DNA_ID=CAMNT_0024947697 /DNA_START=36 /DNA_END=439 /DNA_ORIENTATION=-
MPAPRRLLEPEVAGWHGGEHADQLQRHAELDKVVEAVAALAGDHQVGLVRHGGRVGGRGRHRQRVERRTPRDLRRLADLDDHGEHQDDHCVVGDDGADADGHEVHGEQEGQLAVRSDQLDDTPRGDGRELRLVDG